MKIQTTLTLLLFLLIIKPANIYSQQVEAMEYYLRDASGKEIGVLDMLTGKWIWYVYGNNGERVAKVSPEVEQQPGYYPEKFGSFADVDTLRIKVLLEELQTSKRKGYKLPDRLLKIELTDGKQYQVLEKRLKKEFPDLKYKETSAIPINDDKQLLQVPKRGGSMMYITIGQLREGRDTEPIPNPRPVRVHTDPFYDPYVFRENTALSDITFYNYDHLGNTRITYSPKVSNGVINYTLDNVVDYFPYGKILRSYFNGQREKYLFTRNERDNETDLDYMLQRNYDSDIARFISVDKLADKFPALTTYQYASCNPVLNIDLDGAEGIQGGFSQRTGFYFEAVDASFITPQLKLQKREESQQAILKPYEANIFERTQNYLESSSEDVFTATAKFTGRFGYNILNDLYKYGTGLAFGKSGARDLSGAGINTFELTTAGTNTFLNFVPLKRFGSLFSETKILNIAEFSSKFKGTEFLKGSALERGWKLREYNFQSKQILSSEKQVSNTSFGLSLFGQFSNEVKQ